MQFEEIYELALVGSVSTLVGARPVKSKYVVNLSQVGGEARKVAIWRWVEVSA